MLGKLIKYEFKATYKFMLMLYGVLLIISAFMGFSYRIEPADGILYSGHFRDESAVVDAVRILIAILFVAIMFVVITSVFFYYINRFRKTALGDSGYLYHTLPVKTHNHILAKCISALFWTVASFIVAVMAYFIFIVIMYSSVAENIWHELGEFMGMLFEELGKNALKVTLLLISGIVSIFALYLQIFASMAVGYSANRHRAVKAIGVFVLFMFADSIFCSLFEPLKESLTQYRTIYAYSVSTPATISIDIALTAIFGAALFFITRYFLKNKLNLQ